MSTYCDYSVAPRYDLRQLPVGGWASSRIKVETTGRWSRFSHADSGRAITSSTRIDYSAEYVPPRRAKKRQTRETDLEDLDDGMFVAQIGSPVVPPISGEPLCDITPEMLASAPTATPRRPNTSRLKTESTAAARPAKSHVFRFDNVEVPQTSRIVPQRKGERLGGRHVRANGEPLTARRRPERKEGMVVVGRR